MGLGTCYDVESKGSQSFQRYANENDYTYKYH